ncbi:hypothetical protein PFISCL1PPCAC_28545, partial [Pristionchus fissidentatus]
RTRHQRYDSASDLVCAASSRVLLLTNEADQSWHSANPGGGMPKACTAISQWPVVDCNAVYSGLFTCSAISINAAGITCPVGNFIMKGSTGFLSPTSIVCDSATGQYTTVAASETFNEAMLTTNIGAPFLLACIS